MPINSPPNPHRWPARGWIAGWLADCFGNTCSKLEWKIIEIISLIGSRYIFVFRWRFSGMERGGGGGGGGSCIMLLMFVRLCMCVCAGMLLLLHEIKQFEQGPGPTSRQIPVDRRFVQHSIGAPESGDEEIVIRSNYVIFLSYLDTNVLHQTHAHTHPCIPKDTLLLLLLVVVISSFKVLFFAITHLYCLVCGGTTDGIILTFSLRAISRK